MKRKLFLIFTTIVFIVALTVLAANMTKVSAATYSGSCGTNVTWNLNPSTGVLTISGSGTMNDYSSKSYNGTYATSAPWGQYYSSIKNVTINSGVTSIGNYAFRGCTGLTSITIPDSVTRIGKYAFWGCKGLKSISIPDSVTKIEYDAFYDCTGLTRVDISDLLSWCKLDYYSPESNPLYYAHHLYINKKLLTDLMTPNYITTIGCYAFSGCTDLSNALLSDSVINIGAGAFYKCIELTNITIPISVTSFNYNIGSPGAELGPGRYHGVLEECNGINTMSIPGTLSLYKAFGNNTPNMVKNITILGNNIDNSAFSGCTGLTSITIPDSVTNIGDSAFSGCTGLTSITIPDSVTSIGERTIPDSVTSIGERAFSGCTGLTSVTIPDSVTSIGSGAFNGCKKLETVIVPEEVADIASNAFDNCVFVTLYVVKDSYAQAFCQRYNIPYQIYDPYDPDVAPVSPMVETVEARSVTLVAVEGVEYSKDRTSWQSSNVFTGLSPASNYTFYARYKKTASSDASSPSRGTRVTTLKDVKDAPPVPSVEGISSRRIVLLASDGVEYSRGGASWQSSGVFEGLTPNTEYSFYARYAETDQFDASEPSPAVTVSTPKDDVSAPEAPTLAEVRNNTAVVSAIAGYEYSLDGVIWQKSYVFTDLSPGRSYTLYARIAETPISNASPSSAGTGFETLKNEAVTPLAPVVEKIEPTKVTLQAIPDAEYSLDRVVWQSSPVFDGLTAGNTYTFFMRFIENETTYAGEAGPGTTVSTSKTKPQAPSAPVIKKAKNGQVELIKTDGVEYSYDGSMWKSDPVFNDLIPGIEYTFYARIAETEISYASDASAGTVIVLGKPEITGNVKLAGVATVGSTLTPLVSGVEYTDVRYDYVWYRNGNIIENKTAALYIVTYADVGSVISVELTANGNYEGTLKSDGRMILEAAGISSPSVIVNSITAVKENEFAVKVELVKNCGINTLVLTPELPEGVVLVRVENGEIFPSLETGVNFVFDTSDESDTNKEGTLVTMILKADKEAEFTDCEIGLTVIDCADSNEQIVAVASTPGKLKLIEYLFGDVNGDGEITAVDIVRLKKYFAEYDAISGASSVGIGAGADANGDGNITALDVIRLKKYLAAYDPKTGVSTVRLGPQA